MAMEANAVNRARAEVHLSGRLDIQGYRSFRDSVEAAVNADGAAIQLDFGDVSYADSTTLSWLLLVRESAKGAGKQVSMTNVSGSVGRLLEIANFKRIFTIS